MDVYILDQFTDKKKGLAPLYTTPCYKVGGDLGLSPLGAVGLTELRYSPILVFFEVTSSPSLLVQVSSL